MGRMGRGVEITVTLMLLLIFASALTISSASEDSMSRNERAAKSTCEEKYKKYSPQHTLCGIDLPDATSIELARKAKDGIVRWHNQFRSKVKPTAANMLKMQWDENLARSAAKWAMRCSLENDAEKNRHEPDWDKVNIGQLISTNDNSFLVMIKKFFAEQNKYIYGQTYKRNQYDHYYQLVWSSANRVGCGEAFCPQTRYKRIRVCNYATSSEATDKPYEEGKSCSACPKHCKGRLCDCGNKLCYNGGRLNVTTCKCDCPGHWKGDSCEKGEQNEERCDPKYYNFRPSHTRCTTGHPEATLVELDAATKKLIVDHHNQLRANVIPTAGDMQKLIWDETLAGTAGSWALHCSFAHDSEMNRQEPNWPNVLIGQSIGNGHPNFKTMLDNFYKEKDKYSYVYGQGYAEKTGHYTQLVNSQATRIGCAQASCPHTKFKVNRVCNYAAGMNYKRKTPYKKGKPCEFCPNSPCKGDLCVSDGKLCFHGSVLDSVSGKCQCSGNWKGEKCDQLDCDSDDSLEMCLPGGVSASQCGKELDVDNCPHLCGKCDPCTSSFDRCLNGGTIKDKAACECACPDGFLGQKCEKKVPDCSKVCGAGGTLQEDNTCQCQCPRNKWGPNCKNGCFDTQFCSVLAGKMDCSSSWWQQNCPHSCRAETGCQA